MKIGTIGDKDIDLSCWSTFWFLLGVYLVPVMLVVALVGAMLIIGSISGG